jgi:DNA polymerase-3 subunit alpha
MMHKFDCGCEFPIVGPAKPGFTIPRLSIDFLNLPYSCPKTWELAALGKTIGCFQIESPLGRQITKKVKPTTIEHVGAITSIMRPGVLKAFVDNKSMTDHYADRKNGLEPIKEYHPAVDKCLEETFSILVYQEQAIRLAKEIAGFTLEEADSLRKAMGKKIASEMAKVKAMFITKAKEVGILTEQQIDEVFGWIQESQRYSFNHSHAVGYGLLGFMTMYIKAHFPTMFYTSWLKDSIEQADGEDDVKNLVADAQSSDIKAKR